MRSSVASASFPLKRGPKRSRYPCQTTEGVGSSDALARGATAEFPSLQWVRTASRTKQVSYHRFDVRPTGFGRRNPTRSAYDARHGSARALSRSKPKRRPCRPAARRPFRVSSFTYACGRSRERFGKSRPGDTGTSRASPLLRPPSRSEMLLSMARSCRSFESWNPGTDAAIFPSVRPRTTG
jgi:hypothetical protein